MKKVFLFLSILAFLGSNIWAMEACRKRAHLRINHDEKSENVQRLPAKPFVQVEDVNNSLFLTFQCSLANADIVITDKNGNEVVNEQQTLIYEGKVIAISPSDGYPYAIEITSSTVDIIGEVVLMEE